jgi:hypothetical protein
MISLPIDRLKTVFLVAGMLPMGILRQNRCRNCWLRRSCLLQPIGSLAVLEDFSAGRWINQAVNGPVVAAILAPIAIAALKILVLIPGQWRWNRPIASMAFITPLTPGQHPGDGVGGYNSKTILKVGPLVVMLTIAVLVLLPIFWPL